MATLIPEVKWEDFVNVAKAGKLKQLKSCEVKDEGEYLFTFVNAQTDYIRVQTEYHAQLGNSLSGKSVEDLLVETAADVPQSVEDARLANLAKGREALRLKREKAAV